MRLHHSPLSPFARKCRILIRAKGLEVEEVIAGPNGSNGYAASVNPLGKVPCLEREGAVPLFDSPVICEYLDSLGNPWLPATGEARWKALRAHRIGDGLAEAVYNYRCETVRDDALHWPKMIERHNTAIRNTIAYLEDIVGYLPRDWSFGTIAIICALDYADYRAEHIDWRELAPKLSAWHERFKIYREWSDTNGYFELAV